MAQSMTDAGEALEAAWRRLAACREAAADAWGDAVRQQFERDFMQPLAAEVPATLKAMERLSELFAQVRRSVR